MSQLLLGLDDDPSGGATFDASRKYRYQLWREWDRKLPRFLGIGLNGSIAGERENDPTVRKLVGFGRRLGFGGFVLVNKYGLVSTDPAGLALADDPVGPKNDQFIQGALRNAETVILMWGASGPRDERAARVLEMVRKSGKPAKCFGRNADGSPRHPLYLPYETTLEDFPV